MKPVPRSREHDHQFVSEALPWYVNGTLDEASLSRVREHTAHCTECRLAVEMESRLAGAMRALPIIDMVPQPALAKVMARIDAHEARWSWLSRLVKDWSGTGTHRALALTAGFQAVAIVLLVIVLATLGTNTRPAEYRTLSNGSATGHYDGPLVRVVFDGQLTAEKLRGLMEQIDGNIVLGPDEAGLFTVKLPAGTEAPEAVADWLRAQPGIRLAEVVVIQGT